MVDEFGTGAFSMIIVEDMTMKEAAELEKQVEGIGHVKDVLWYDDRNLPEEDIASQIKENGKSDRKQENQRRYQGLAM